MKPQDDDPFCLTHICLARKRGKCPVPQCERIILKAIKIKFEVIKPRELKRCRGEQ